MITYGQPVTKLDSYTIEGALILEKHCDKGAKKLVDGLVCKQSEANITAKYGNDFLTKKV
ncbi:MAG: hypothetical protein WB511_12890 [Nitrososphaeraceae archaeon]